MAVTGVTQEQYKKFLENGGKITFLIDGSDISKKQEFEEFPTIKPLLTTGFEIRPSTIIHSSDVYIDIMVHGDHWTRVSTFVYKHGGNIVYKKLEDGRYQADCSIPRIKSEN